MVVQYLDVNGRAPLSSSWDVKKIRPLKVVGRQKNTSSNTVGDPNNEAKNALIFEKTSLFTTILHARVQSNLLSTYFFRARFSGKSTY